MEGGGLNVRHHCTYILLYLLQILGGIPSVEAHTEKTWYFNLQIIMLLPGHIMIDQGLHIPFLHNNYRGYKLVYIVYKYAICFILSVCCFAV